MVDVLKRKTLAEVRKEEKDKTDGQVFMDHYACPVDYYQLQPRQYKTGKNAGRWYIQHVHEDGQDYVELIDKHTGKPESVVAKKKAEKEAAEKPKKKSKKEQPEEEAPKKKNKKKSKSEDSEAEEKPKKKPRTNNTEILKNIHEVVVNLDKKLTEFVNNLVTEE